MAEGHDFGYDDERLDYYIDPDDDDDDYGDETTPFIPNGASNPAFWPIPSSCPTRNGNENN